MTLSNTIKGVLFDIDDTLVDTRGAFAHCVTVLVDTFMPHLPPERHHEVLAMWRTDPNGHYRAYTRGEKTAREQRMARANEVHEAFGGQILNDAGFDEWDAVFQNAFRTGWQPFAESRTVVDELRAQGILVGALSNAPRAMQTEKLAICGLDDVDLLVTLDTFGVGKPDPRVFLEAVRLLGLSPEHVAYVGDELDFDARGAVHAGLGQGIWVDRAGTRRGGPHDESHDHAADTSITVVKSLADLLKRSGN
ncbi:HAD family hydrolase [Timonella sp. A28]|uniref:HAD family hydrolase n=1 Tax=Timonella sp. A28 TaxID=3442640 RepID=UPI003EB7065E